MNKLYFSDSEINLIQKHLKNKEYTQASFLLLNKTFLDILKEEAKQKKIEQFADILEKNVPKLTDLNFETIKNLAQKVS